MTFSLEDFVDVISDSRGKIVRIASGVDVLRITSLAGTKRAAHYHKESCHWCVLISGSMTYYERPEFSSNKPTKYEIKKYEIKPGNYFYTGPMVEHLMVFNEDSVFDCYSSGSRKQGDYENDLVRIDWDLEKIFNEDN